MAEFDAILPAVLAELYDGVAHALRRIMTKSIRLAIYGWRTRQDGSRLPKGLLAEENGTVIDAIAVAQNEFVVDRVNDDPLVMKLRAITRGRPFEGYIGELFFEDEFGSRPRSQDCRDRLPTCRNNWTACGRHWRRSV